MTPMGAPTHPFWISAFLDIAPQHWDAALAFWPAATGTTLSALRGDDQEFATLVPADGDDHLRIQRRGDGLSRIHLDVHVTDPARAADRAVELGAEVVHRSTYGYIVLHSPGGLTFCFVDHPAAVRPTPADHGGYRSAVDQVCIDVPSSRFDTESAFWAALTGWREHAGAMSCFTLVKPPRDQPTRLLLQKLDDEPSAVTAHLDIAVTDRTAETIRHTGLGAQVVAEHDRWTVLRAPDGLPYCLTDRDPETGSLIG